MEAILNLMHPVSRCLRRHVALCVITMATAIVLADAVSAQCIDTPDKKTALKFNNESRFELTFFIDNDQQGIVVASGTVSIEVEVEAGQHLLRARAVVLGEGFWVWSVNEVPAGQVCTWTVTDPMAAEMGGYGTTVGRTKRAIADKTPKRAATSANKRQTVGSQNATWQ